MRTSFVVAIAGTAGIALSYFLGPTTTAQQPATAAIPANVAVHSPERAAGSAAAPTPQPAPAELQLRFPNGETAAALNGVTSQPAVCVWGDQPWSPIVEREWHNGLEWYVHADGSYTTTQMTWRSDLGRHDAMTLCVHPRAGVPTQPAMPRNH